MNFFVKYDLNILGRVAIAQVLEELALDYRIKSLGEIEIVESLDIDSRTLLADKLAVFGIAIVDDEKTALVQRIKLTIDTLIKDKEGISVKLSVYLSNVLNYSYAYLSNLFSELTHTSIENYVILCKVDYVKELIGTSNLTLTEIAFRLHYSSVAHLSGQFKKTTGLTPSSFQKILKKRKERLE